MLGLRYYHCRKNRKIIALNAHGSLLQRHWFVIAVVSNVIQRGRIGFKYYDNARALQLAPQPSSLQHIRASLFSPFAYNIKSKGIRMAPRSGS